MSPGNRFTIWRESCTNEIVVLYCGQEIIKVPDMRELVRLSVDLSAEVMDFVREEIK